MTIRSAARAVWTSVHGFAVLGHPLVVRELRTRMRGKRTFLTVFLYNLALTGALLLVYEFAVRQSAWQSTETGLGRTLFQVMAFAELILMLLVAPTLTSGAISAERERRSLDLAVITLLTPIEFAWGKLVAALSFALVLLFSSAPLIGICFMLGGVSVDEITQTLVVTLTSIVSMSALGLMCSAWCKRTVSAVMLTMVSVMLFTVGVPILLAMVGSKLRVDDSAIMLSCALFSAPFELFMILNTMSLGISAIPANHCLGHTLFHLLLAACWVALAARRLVYPREAD